MPRGWLCRAAVWWVVLLLFRCGAGFALLGIILDSRAMLLGFVFVDLRR